MKLEVVGHNGILDIIQRYIRTYKDLKIQRQLRHHASLLLFAYLSLVNYSPLVSFILGSNIVNSNIIKGKIIVRNYSNRIISNQSFKFPDH